MNNETTVFTYGKMHQSLVDFTVKYLHVIDIFDAICKKPDVIDRHNYLYKNKNQDTVARLMYYYTKELLASYNRLDTSKTALITELIGFEEQIQDNQILEEALLKKNGLSEEDKKRLEAKKNKTESINKMLEEFKKLVEKCFKYLNGYFQVILQTEKHYHTSDVKIIHPEAKVTLLMDASSIIKIVDGFSEETYFLNNENFSQNLYGMFDALAIQLRSTLN